MAKTAEEKKIAQAAAHKRWRESQKGKDYYARKRNDISERQQAGQEIQGERTEVREEETSK